MSFDIINDIVIRRGLGVSGYNSANWIKHINGKAVPIAAFEPDPTTSRTEFYYNSRVNLLFKKILAIGTSSNVCVWKRIST